ncbi:DUF262 domain-containing protein [Nostocoides vanveenii]|uniref:GmrSD restriction endonucleases N-terminal domain-containing protein n=1 Tax=Nostocoides vanveenii TaxID=330835 RepID=A0ABP4X875_9MICO
MNRPATFDDATTPAGSESVRDLLRRREGNGPGSWNLALVQRDEVWDHVRMRHLLDSLLAGYPIGSILLCRVKQASRVIRSHDGERVVEDADATGWQLLDGQQRINALVSMLTDKGRYGRFYLHMTMRRNPPGATHKRHSKEQTLRHIAWRESPDDPLPDRHLHVDLSGWSAWAESALTPSVRFDAANVEGALRTLDPEFTAQLTDVAAAQAADRLNALAHAWSRPSVPVLKAEVESPLDVLEVFTRINLGGVQVAGSDVYFAAVKTFWTEAEERLARVARATPFLHRRFDPLRFVSRLASRAIGQGDLLPLNVERLTGKSGEPLRLAMQDLTAQNSAALRRIAAFSSWYSAHSQLGFVLNLVTPELWDDVLAWAAGSDRDDDSFADNRASIDAYLLGATIFRYRAVLGDRFHRLAFLEALAAGAQGLPFPTDQILAVSRAGSGLQNRRQVVRGLSAADRQAVADQNGRILTCLAQRIPYQSEDVVDWDHVFPSAQARRMWAQGAGRRKHHPDRWLVNTAGNVWALDASTNRSLQDKPPRVKFPILLGKVADADAAGAVWPRERWSITDEEVRQFIEVDELLDDNPENVERAMAQFKALVTGRTARLLDEALNRFPGIQLFAADAEVLPDDPSAIHEFLEALQVSRREPGSVAEVAVDVAAGPSGWDGRDDELAYVAKRVVKKLTTRSRAFPYRSSPGFVRAAYVWIGEPDDDTHVAIGLTNVFDWVETTPFWLRVHAETGGFETVLARLMASPLAARVVLRPVSEDDHATHAWLPLDAPPHLTWDDLAEHLTAQARRIRAVIVDNPLESK